MKIHAMAGGTWMQFVTDHRLQDQPLQRGVYLEHEGDRYYMNPMMEEGYDFWVGDDGDSGVEGSLKWVSI